MKDAILPSSDQVENEANNITPILLENSENLTQYNKDLNMTASSETSNNILASPEQTENETIHIETTSTPEVDAKPNTTSVSDLTENCLITSNETTTLLEMASNINAESSSNVTDDIPATSAQVENDETKTLLEVMENSNEEINNNSLSMIPDIPSTSVQVKDETTDETTTLFENPFTGYPIRYRKCTNTADASSIKPGDANISAKIKSKTNTKVTPTSPKGIVNSIRFRKGINSTASCGPISFPNAKYSAGDMVFCYYGIILYEAKILKVNVFDGVLKYFVHYHGWKNKWDEWVEENK